MNAGLRQSTGSLGGKHKLAVLVPVVVQLFLEIFIERFSGLIQQIILSLLPSLVAHAHLSRFNSQMGIRNLEPGYIAFAAAGPKPERENGLGTKIAFFYDGSENQALIIRQDSGSHAWVESQFVWQDFYSIIPGP
jgi:hypothetical protein